MNDDKLHRKIKERLDEHEFDFSPQAWEDLHAQLDDPGNTSRKRRPTYFFTFKIWLAMITGLFVLMFLLLQQDPPASVQVLQTQVLQTPNSSLAPTGSTPVTLSGSAPFTAQEAQKPPFSWDFSLSNADLKVGQPDTVNGVLPVTTTQDTSFFDKIATALSGWQRQFSPEKVYLHFDRTYFEPGEAIWFNAYVRNANSLKASPKSELLYVELTAPNGSVLKKITLLAKGGVAAGDFQLDPEAPGGVYKIKAWTNWQRNLGDAFERDIQVQASVLPRLRMELDFVRKAYGAGDQVEADLDLNTLANQPLANFAFTAVASLDGQQFLKTEGVTDAKGYARLRFSLPKKLETNDGLLNVLIQYEGQTESISRSIPIVMNKIDLQFLPEGGDLVAGIGGVVAFKAINEFGKPADVEGKVFNSKGQAVADFKSYHQGLGAFEFTPQLGEIYSARLTKPEGISENYSLPVALARGFSLKINPLQASKLQVEINSTENEALHVALVSRGKIYFTQTFPPQAGSHRLEIPTTSLPIGVAQISLFDSREIPRAERLVFLNPHKQLKVAITTDKPKYLPREQVKMTVKVTDERGLPMPGQFSLAVADDNLLTFADDKQGHILSHLLLESELKGKVEEPNFYFEPKEKHPGKDERLALDYLMLTQGWRRVSWEGLLYGPVAAVEFGSERAVTTGKVVDVAGKPVPRLKLSLQGKNFHAVTDENGDFELDTLMKWNDLIHLKANTLSPSRLAIQKRENGTVLQLSTYVANVAHVETKTRRLGKLQETQAQVAGKIEDERTGEPLIGANVLVFQNGEMVEGMVADVDGSFESSKLPPGKYDLEVAYTGFRPQRFSGVELAAGKSSWFELPVTASEVSLDEIVVTSVRPLIEQDNITQAMTLTSEERRKKAGASRSQPKAKKSESKPQPASPAPGNPSTSEEIKDLPTRNVNALASLAAGVASANEGDDINIRGSRSDATNFFVDGVRVNGRAVPRDEKEEEVSTKMQWGETAKIAADFSGFHAPRQFYSPKYEAADRSDTIATRTDFRKTIFWQPLLEVSRNGTATVEFFNSDAISTFRATVEGIGLDGSPGRGEQRFFTQLPFGMSVKAPVNLLTGDRLLLPLTLTNNTDRTVTGKLAVEAPAGFSLQNQLSETVTLKAGETKTLYPEYLVGFDAKGGSLQVAFQANSLQDAFAQTLNVQPRGFPVAQVFGGSEAERIFKVNIADPVEGSLQASFTVHPSVLSDLTTGLERMLGQPGGCFEQTSSTNYPNVLALNLLKTTGNLDSLSGAGGGDLEKKAMAFLDYGYKRLLTFEIKDGGFDWFGTPPAHEALSAYGLMQFVDMKQVYPVEQTLIDRTARWLLTRRDGKGGWLASKNGLHSWQQPNPVSDAYITWAMCEAGFGNEVKTELEKTVRDAQQTADPYILALAANSLLKTGDARTEKLLETLAGLQAPDGSWTGKTLSMTHSTGKNLTVETTALAMLAFLQTGDHVLQVEKAVRYLAAAKTNYGFGSTQATVLALKALVAHAQEFKKSIGGEVALFVNGKKAGEQKFTADQREPITFGDLTGLLKEGENEVKVRFSGTETALPYDLSVSYNTRQPQSDPDCKLILTTTLAQANDGKNGGKTSTQVGETQRLTTVLTNRTDAAVPNPIALVGIPAGLSVQPWQVKELQEKQLCDFYEIKDGFVIFYFRHLDANAVKTIQLDLKAEVPGEFEAPASSAYLYYSNDAMVWSKPENIVIK